MGRGPVALRPYGAVAPAEGHVARHGGELARVVSPLSLRLADVPSASGGEPEAARFAFFGAVADLLEAIGADHPVLIVLDAVHWADPESMLLLQHVALAPVPHGGLIVCTYSQSELTDAHPLTACWPRCSDGPA